MTGMPGALDLTHLFLVSPSIQLNVFAHAAAFKRRPETIRHQAKQTTNREQSPERETRKNRLPSPLIAIVEQCGWGDLSIHPR